MREEFYDDHRVLADSIQAMRLDLNKAVVKLTPIAHIIRCQSKVEMSSLVKIKLGLFWLKNINNQCLLSTTQKTY